MLKIWKIIWVPLVFISVCTVQAQNKHSSQTVGLAQVIKISPLPEPTNNPYPDCLMLLELRMLKVKSGPEIPTRIAAAFWGFRDRKFQPAASYRPGDLLTVKLIPFTEAALSVQTVQQSDTLDDYSLVLFWAEDTAKISHQDNSSGVIPRSSGKNEKTKEFITITTSANVEYAAVMRQQSMLQDLQWIEAALERHGGNWDSWYDSLQPLRDDLNTKLIQAGGTLQKEDKFFYSMGALNFKLTPMPGIGHNEG